MYLATPNSKLKTLVLWFGVWCLLGACSLATTINFEVIPQYEVAFAQHVSITRLDFLLSNISLRRTDGVWIQQTNWFACIKAGEGQTRFQLTDVPPGNYDCIRFFVGLPSDINHADIAQYPATHPLNPNVNGLHWSWQGGFVFLALEGNWQRADGTPSGFSYHLATDRQLMTVELPATLDLSTDHDVRLVLNVDKILQGIEINDSTTSTHSRTNDILANTLHNNVETAFSVESIISTQQKTNLPQPLSKIEIAPNATPYRLTISRFFPQPALPLDNPLTDQGVQLGRHLFNDSALSINHQQSCASCHSPARAFTDGKTVSTGAEGTSGTRNAMPLLNLAWKSSFFWDGRATTLREQVLQPIQNPIEMHESLSNVVGKLASNTNYLVLFRNAFGSPEITADRIARALEQFLLVQISHNSKFDHVIAGETKFNDEEQRGFELFHTEYDPRRGQFGADCFHCHGGPLFQSQNFANNGLNSIDTGRQHVTNRDGDRGKFSVPSLRNVEVTAPYMHDGRFATLEEVVEHYSSGVQRSSTLDPNLAKHPDGGLHLSDADKKALVAFLKTLTDEKFLPTPIELSAKH